MLVLIEWIHSASTFVVCWAILQLLTPLSRALLWHIAPTQPTRLKHDALDFLLPDTTAHLQGSRGPAIKGEQGGDIILDKRSQGYCLNSQVMEQLLGLALIFSVTCYTVLWLVVHLNRWGKITSLLCSGWGKCGKRGSAQWGTAS